MLSGTTKLESATTISNQSYALTKYSYTLINSLSEPTLRGYFDLLKHAFRTQFYL